MTTELTKQDTNDIVLEGVAKVVNDDPNVIDEERTSVKQLNPKSVFDNFKFPFSGCIILFHELLERYSFYGMKVLLSVYLKLYLKFDKDMTTILYHLFTAVCYLAPIGGAIISDNYLGRFKTVMFVGILYMFGHIAMTLTSIKWNKPGPLIAMFVLAIGAGGIKSSVAAFGGDQIPANNVQMIEVYFSIFYACINIGAFFAQIISPILRRDVACVDGECYPLAFGVSGAMFVIAYFLFVCCKHFYRIEPSKKNVLTDFVRCIFIGVNTKLFGPKDKEQHANILDYGNKIFEQDFIEDCKTVMRIIFIFIPLPLFWAAWDQQGSRWTLQAQNMDGRIGSKYMIKPEQIQSFNPLLVIFMLPFFNIVFYPLLSKLHMLRRATSKIISAYFVCAAAFIIAGFIELKLNSNVLVPRGQGYVIVQNLIDRCEILSVKFDLEKESKQFNLSISESHTIIVTSDSLYNVTFIPICNIPSKSIYAEKVKSRSVSNILVNVVNNDTVIQTTKEMPVLGEGYAYVNFVDFQFPVPNRHLHLRRVGKDSMLTYKYKEFQSGFYSIVSDNSVLQELTLLPNYIVSLTFDSADHLRVVYSFVPQQMHMLMQLPQYILITAAEILCSVTTMAYAYSQSPASMKSLLQSVYLITIFIGNIIVTLVAIFGTLLQQYIEFFIFAVLVSLAGLCNWALILKFAKDN